MLDYAIITYGEKYLTPCVDLNVFTEDSLRAVYYTNQGPRTWTWYLSWFFFSCEEPQNQFWFVSLKEQMHVLL